MIIIFDRQHVGKPGRTVEDLGAGADLDGDGEVEVSEREAILTPAYIYPGKDYAEGLGHTVHVFDQGSYPQRQARANEIARTNPDEMVAYIACHFNAGGGDYGLYLNDARSSLGAALCDEVAARVELLGMTRRTLVRAASREDWKNAWYTIAKIWDGPGNIAGMCAEPLFLDNEEHQSYLQADPLARLGRALVDGCISWSQL